MKVVSLILYMCSVTANTCMPPYVWPTQFGNSYDCMVAGYEEALRKTKEIGSKEMNQHKIILNLIVWNQPLLFLKKNLKKILNLKLKHHTRYRGVVFMQH